MLMRRENVYTCSACGRHLVTVDRDEGVTPYTMRCDPARTKGGCGGRMYSAGYPAGPRPSHIGPPTHEWYRPTSQELDAACAGEPRHVAAGLREHVRLGGLLIRPGTTIHQGDVS